MRKYEDRLWGYVEIDQGGRENKIKTRARLEALGLSPIPVYHPFNDGWDYFDELAQNYDRICVGNIVAAMPPVRRRMMATIWQRKRAYPHLWIHILGLTPNQSINAYPMESADSSSWMSPLRWSSTCVYSDGAAFDRYPPAMRYELGNTDSRIAGEQFAIYNAYINMLIWRAHLAEYRACGFELFPPEDQ